MNQNYDKAFINKYRQGQCSAEEEAAFMKWLSEADNADHVQGWMKQLWNEAAQRPGQVLGAEERILGNILAQIAPGDQSLSKTGKSLKVSAQGYLASYRPTFIRYAAVIFLIMLPLSMWFMYHKSPDETGFTMMAKQTHNGQHLKFGLEDGTRIVLNSNSKLEFPEHFDDTSRVVYLVGEAFFNVAKDAKRPFKVITGSLSTTALGTSFNIHYHPGKAVSSVALVSGSVMVNVANFKEEGIYLQPGEMLTFDLLQKQYLRQEFDKLEITGWKDGIIQFKEADLDEVVTSLEEWYDVHIALSGNFARAQKSTWTYTGKFKNQNLESVLLGIGYVKKFDYEIDGKNVKIIFK
ncbi:MAG: DUF4974 domain-containing protein [Cyclobacteriaceae bacterium]|nr:DUF4974 domain-containing protein [Cyclobacteriaceae bacterium]